MILAGTLDPSQTAIDLNAIVILFLLDLILNL